MSIENQKQSREKQLGDKVQQLAIELANSTYQRKSKKEELERKETEHKDK